MRFVALNKKEDWAENCVLHHGPMRPAEKGLNDEVLGVVDSFPQQILQSERAKINFANWTQNPVVQPNPYFWYCDVCKVLYGVVLGEWIRTQWNKEIEPLIEVATQNVTDKIIDRTPPFKGATMCPHCHSWRHIIHTEVNGTGEHMHITQIHYCINCKGTDKIVTGSSQSIQKQIVNDFMKDNMTLEGLIGERNPIKLT